MINHNLDELISTADNVLLLQGPIGSFFYEFSVWMKTHNKRVFKLNFNGGDEYFYPNHAENTFAYRDSPAQFSEYLSTFCTEHHIDTLVCFGDNRRYHQIAKQIAKKFNLHFWAFEEGYFRPEYITLEKEGVNAYSPIPKDRQFFCEVRESLVEPSAPLHVAKGFLPMAKRAVQYHWYAKQKISAYPEYCHHKNLSICHYLKLWTISGIKRAYYYIHDCHFANRVIKGEFGEFYILPLQLYNDSQVQVHSDYDSVADYLKEVLHSFAVHAKAHFNLIIKHHPMDRGFIDYSNVIDDFIRRYPHLKKRVFYIHDVPMPVLLRKAVGMVTLNSTSGISALLHNMPVKVIGRANYDFEGMTDQKPLDEFWNNPAPPVPEVFAAYHQYHLNKTHLNGSFYSKVILRYPYNRTTED
ncbi:capsule biosynthesis protein [Glaesserella sp.]|uniref:capsule biosynthesis protein n=1 Tax=Glaesserella sp. TaxID=2094731 RepID=UPI0035A059F7